MKCFTHQDVVSYLFPPHSVTDFPPAAASLLSPPEHGTTDPAANAAAAAGPLASPSSTSPASPLLLLLLESGLACNHLAARTLEGIRPILLHLSPALLALFAAAAALRREAEALADEVQQRASEAQARLRFQDTSGLLQAGGGPGRGGDSSGGAGPGGLLLLTAESAALPFVEERDARHLYQGAAWSNELFNRQEEARDAFLKLLREFQEEKGQLDGRRVVAFLQALPTRAQDVLALLLPFSVPWFAELFAATLLRVRFLWVCVRTWLGSFSIGHIDWLAMHPLNHCQMGLGAAHEADDDILPSLSHRGSAATTTTAKSYRGAPQQAGGGRGVKGDGAAGGGRGRMGGDHHGSTSILPSSKKVQLLQDRLRSRGGPTQRASLGASSKRLVSRDGTSGGGGAAAAAAASGSAHHGAGGAAPAAAAAAAAGAAAGSHLPSPEIYFPGNQEFFYHFLRACDSYALNLALARVLGAELARTALGPVPGGAAAPAGGRRPASPVAGGAEQEEDEDGDDAGTSGHAAAGVGGQQLTDPVHLARLKLLARFLGLLMFSPNWSNALPQLALLE